MLNETQLSIQVPLISVFPLLNVSRFHFVLQQTIRELFDVNDGEKREVAVELSVPQAEEEEAVNKQSTTILEQVGYTQYALFI